MNPMSNVWKSIGLSDWPVYPLHKKRKKIGLECMPVVFFMFVFFSGVLMVHVFWWRIEVHLFCLHSPCQRFPPIQRWFYG